MTKTLFIILLALSFNFCKPSAPKRLAGIPEKTFWAGGDTLGHWFLVDSINKAVGTIHLKIYNDKTGKLVANRKFKLHCYLCEDKIVFNNLKDEISYYNEIKYNYENYVKLKIEDADGKNGYFK